MGPIAVSRRYRGKGNGSPVFVLGNPMDRGFWGVQFMGSQRVGHDLETKQQQQYTFVSWFSDTTEQLHFF